MDFILNIPIKITRICHATENSIPIILCVNTIQQSGRAEMGKMQVQ